MSILRGWTRVFAWGLVVVASLGIITTILVITLGRERLAQSTGLIIEANSQDPLWLLTQVTAAALAFVCIATLRGSRRAATGVVIASCLVAALQLLGAILLLVRASHLQLPLMAPVYIAFAIAADRQIASYDARLARAAP